MLKESLISKDLNGISFVNKNIIIDDENVCFQIWDNTFHQQSSYYTSCYLRGSVLCIIVCDVSEDNFEGIFG